MFIVYVGDATHIWEKRDLLTHWYIWNPETEDGRKGVEAHIMKRTVGRI